MFGKTRKVTGIIIGRRDLGESDKLLSIFDSKEGKIRVIAKGVRKNNSRRLGKLELGGKVKILLTTGKNFDFVSEIEVTDSLLKLRNNSVLLGSIIYLCELINLFLPEGEANEKIYRQFNAAREMIKEGKIEAVVQFEANLLTTLGFGMETKEKSLINNKDWKSAHRLLKERLERISERKLKTLAVFG